jgi:hypothetical protein
VGDAVHVVQGQGAERRRKRAIKWRVDIVHRQGGLDERRELFEAKTNIWAVRAVEDAKGW